MTPVQLSERMRRMRDWLSAAACVLCGARVSRGLPFCEGCERSLPALTSCCSRCAVPLEGVVADTPICGQCQQRPPNYASVYAPFRYAAPVDRLIQGAKYAARFDWLEILGQRLADGIAGQRRAHDVDALVPVPLHRARLRERGYNQSLELARALTKRFGLPLRRGIERVRATPPQAAMSRAERRRNVRDAFAANGEFTGLRLAVVDDVMTSGATIEAVTRCLRKAGAASVEVWVVARA